MARGDRPSRPAFDRVMDRVVQDANGCWLWTGSVRGPDPDHKYGCVMTGSRKDGTRKVRATHTVVWEHFNGPVQGELDHLCRVPLCCNPGHLEDVTHRQNMERMVLSDQGRDTHRRTWLAINDRKRVA